MQEGGAGVATEVQAQSAPQKTGGAAFEKSRPPGSGLADDHVADDVDDHRQAQGCHRHGGCLDNMDIGDGLHGDLLDWDLP